MKAIAAAVVLLAGLAVASDPQVSNAALRLQLDESILLRDSSAPLTDAIAFRYDRQSRSFLVIDRASRRIIEFDRAGIAIRTTVLSAQSAPPRALVVDERGDLLVLLEFGPEILRITRGDGSSGAKIETQTLSNDDSTELERPLRLLSIDTDADGGLLLADGGNQALLWVNSKFEVTQVVQGVGAPVSVRRHRHSLYAIDARRGGVLELDSKRRLLRRLAVLPERHAQPLYLQSIALDQRDRLWGLSESGEIVAVGPDDRSLFTGRPTVALRPVAIDSDEQGSVFLLDQANACIHVFDVLEEGAPGGERRW